jgi:hypothetical protein
MRLFGLYALIAVAAAGYSVYWYYLADRTDELVDAQIATWRADGVSVDYDERRTFGYPYRLSSEVTAFAIGDRDGDDIWNWQGEKLTVYAQPWNLRHYVAVFEGLNQIDILQPGAILQLDAAAESARASVVLDDSYQPERASADFGALSLTPRDQAEGITAERAQIHAQRPAADPNALDAAMIVDGLKIPKGLGGALGDLVRNLTLDSTVSGPLPEQLDRTSLAAWRDAGGTVEAHTLSVDWGPVSIDADGTLALDQAFRPLGALTARVIGHDTLIDILELDGAITDKVAAALRFTFALLAVKPPDGGPAVLTIPITIQDGWLAAGPVPVIEIGPVIADPAPAG